MPKFFHRLSAALFALALTALAWLLLPDLWTSFLPSARHQRAGALALIFAGAAFICLQVGAGRRPKELIKGFLLGLAFILWGGEWFLPAGPAVTAIDGAVIAIFVADLGLVIKSGLDRNDAAAPTDR